MCTAPENGTTALRARVVAGDCKCMPPPPSPPPPLAGDLKCMRKVCGREVGIAKRYLVTKRLSMDPLELNGQLSGGGYFRCMDMLGADIKYPGDAMLQATACSDIAIYSHI